MTNTEKLAMMTNHTRDRVRKGKTNIQDILYGSSISYLNYCLSVIDDKAYTLFLRKEQNLISNEKYEESIKVYRTIVKGILHYANNKKEDGWKVSRKWTIYRTKKVRIF